MKSTNDLADRIEFTIKNLLILVEPIKELARGIYHKTIRWDLCAAWAIFTFLVLFFKIDFWLISFTRFKSLYPYHPYLYKAYVFSVVTLGFWIWAWIEVKKRRDKMKILTHAFKNANLQSRIGRLPNLISDYSIDEMTRKMKLTNAGFPAKAFEEKESYIASELGVYIDQIKESREERAVEILYSHYPMTKLFEYNPELTKRSLEYVVGATRASTVTSTFLDSPHLLVGGQTNGGKSTFLRQLIVHLHLKNKNDNFLLIDLKGGLEFTLFEHRKSFNVIPDVLHASIAIEKLEKLLENRMQQIKSENCKDLVSYAEKLKKQGKSVDLHREILVVDEAAEMFLAGPLANSNEVQKARATLSKIARQGRAVGIHMIIATQRPDAKSLDPQVKANLTSVLCFQMMNDASSISVLGNGRASDLPRVPGRAIWKNGMDMVEVQTPFLSVEAAEKLLGERDKVEEKENSVGQEYKPETHQVNQTKDELSASNNEYEITDVKK